MQLYSFRISLRILHPNIDPDLITDELGIKPSRCWQNGDQRKTPKGTKLKGTYKESYWNADPFNYGEYLSTDSVALDIISDVIEYIAPHKQFINKLESEGGRIILIVSTYSQRNYAIEIPPDILKKLSDLGLSIAHDVYPYVQNW